MKSYARLEKVKELGKTTHPRIPLIARSLFLTLKQRERSPQERALKHRPGLSEVSELHC